MRKVFNISVIIPVFNGEKFISEAVESALKQSFKPYEIIVIDDGSTDQSLEILREYGDKIRCIHQNNQGTAASRNQGVKLALGNYFAFLDQDDVWLENKLALQINRMTNKGNLDMSFGLVKIHRQNKNIKKSRNDDIYRGFTPSTLLIKRKSFSQVGFFETRWKIGEWANWYLRAIEKNLNSCMIEEVVAIRRIHKQNKGIIYKSNQKEYVQVIKEYLNRKRKIEIE